MAIKDSEVAKRENRERYAKYVQNVEPKFPIEPQGESWGKASARWAYQIPSGLATTVTYPMDLLKAAGQGEAIGEYDDLAERIPELQKQFPEAPWQNFKGLDKEKYMGAVKTAGEYFPTQGNIERGIEDLTGLPLEAKTRGQQLTRLGASAFGFRGGDIFDKSAKGLKFAPNIGKTLSNRATAGIAAPAISYRAEQAGVPQEYADMLGLGLSQITKGPGSIPTGITQHTMKSGMPLRKFDDITKTTVVNPKAHAAITEAIGTDFRNTVDSIFSEASPAYNEMKTNPDYRLIRSEAMEDVRKSAEGINKTVNTNTIKDRFIKKVNARNTKGFAKSELDQEYLNEVKKLQDAIESNREVSPTEIVDQYRKTSDAYGKTYEMGSSKARNEAKIDALRTFNDTVSEVIQDEYATEPFAEKFIKENAEWSAMKDAEKANEFIEKTVGEKLNFKNAQEILKDSSTSRSLKKMLGKEKFGQVKEIAKDFIQRGNKYKMLKQNTGKSAMDLGKDALLATNHPYVGVPMVAKDLLQFNKGRTLVKQKKSLDWMDL